MDDRQEYLEGKEFIFVYGVSRILPPSEKTGGLFATEQRAYRRERVVRCRDCARAEPMPLTFSDRLICAFLDDMSVEPDGFCSWAKPMEEDS